MATAERPSRNLLPVVIVAVLVAGAVAAYRAWEISRSLVDEDARAFRIDASDAPAPPTVLDALGGRFDLAAAKGQVVFLNFWATWCPPCRDELPSMLSLGRELSAKYPGKFKMVAVSVDDDWETVLKFFAGAIPSGVTLARDGSQSVTRAYYCAARGRCPQDFKFPETYIVDGNGRIVAYVVGPRDWDSPAIRSFLDRLLKR
jgi:thiol-disulfide isomerase/thioredoxin